MSFFIIYIHTTTVSPWSDVARVIRNGTIINKNDVISTACSDVNSDPSYRRIWTFSSVISNITMVGKGICSTYANSFCPIFCWCGGQTINIVIRYGAFVDK